MAATRARGSAGAADNASPEGAATPNIRWDDSEMSSTYANVCNVSSTREEVVFVFGVNQAWQRDQDEVVVQLSNRIILSPFAAKRMALLLGNVLKEYESRFGELKLEGLGSASSGSEPPAS